MSQVIDENNITNKDLFNMMENVLGTNETIKKQNDEIEIELPNIKQELISQIEELKEENTYLKEEVEKLKARVLTIEEVGYRAGQLEHAEYSPYYPPEAVNTGSRKNRKQSETENSKPRSTSRRVTQTKKNP
ncbi:hypothetical protein JTB14_024285 [Gonioctena quinquepunctata]|nr:hypothetical protein JTB14_024285 [Gonioctena quinquepunctata]